MNIDFNFCQVSIVEKNLKYSYNRDFGSSLNIKDFELKVWI